VQRLQVCRTHDACIEQGETATINGGDRAGGPMRRRAGEQQQGAVAAAAGESSNRGRTSAGSIPLMHRCTTWAQPAPACQWAPARRCTHARQASLPAGSCSASLNPPLQKAFLQSWIPQWPSSTS